MVWGTKERGQCETVGEVLNTVHFKLTHNVLYRGVLSKIWWYNQRLTEFSVDVFIFSSVDICSRYAGFLCRNDISCEAVQNVD